MRNVDEIDEISKALQRAASLSTSYRPPNFNDANVLEAWVKKFSNIPIAHLVKAIDKLSGEEKFPAPNQILDLAKSYLRNEKSVPSESEGDNRARAKQLLYEIGQLNVLKRIRNGAKTPQLGRSEWYAVMGLVQDKAEIPLRLELNLEVLSKIKACLESFSGDARSLLCRSEFDKLTE